MHYGIACRDTYDGTQMLYTYPYVRLYHWPALSEYAFNNYIVLLSICAFKTITQ